MINLINILRQISIYVFFITGVYFLLSNTIGLIRFSDLYTRLYVGSKCLMSGVSSILIGCIFLEGISIVSLKLIVITLFLLITNQVAIHVIANFDYNSDLTQEAVTKHDID